MRPRRMSDLARAVGGLFIGEDVEVTSVATHSDDVVPGALFVAIRGFQQDGAAFIGSASTACVKKAWALSESPDRTSSSPFRFRAPE